MQIVSAIKEWVSFGTLLWYIDLVIKLIHMHACMQSIFIIICPEDEVWSDGTQPMSLTSYNVCMSSLGL